MNSKQKRALKLVERYWGPAEFIDGKVYFEHDADPVSWRDIYWLAYCDHTPYSQSVKHYRHRKNRGETNKRISSGNFDKFSRGHLAKDENIWTWN